MNIKTVGVVGCGIMGSGIAETIAQNGYKVFVTEATSELLNVGISRIKNFLDVGVKRGKITKELSAKTIAAINPTLDWKNFGDCQLVIEAITEKMEEKKEVFKKLDSICPPETIFASNTSSLSITEMAATTKRMSQVIGMHFFNPVPIMKLVEIVKPETVSERVYIVCRKFAESLGKQVVLSKDSPGFIVNRLLIPYLLGAARIYEEGLATKEDIDTAMRLGCNHPMGPLELTDFVGVDTTYYIAEAMYKEFKDPRFAAPPILKRMVLAGLHGRKAGKGFYDYTKK